MEELVTGSIIIGVLKVLEPGDTEEMMPLITSPTASKIAPNDLVVDAVALTALNLGLSVLRTVDDEDDEDDEDQNHH